MDGIKYRVTVGEYEDEVEVGTFDTELEALAALGRFAVKLHRRESIQYPKVEKVDADGNHLGYITF